VRLNNIVRCHSRFGFTYKNMKLPDLPFRVKDPKALTIITQEGLLGDFPDTSGAKPMHNSLVFQKDHSTHWIVAVHQVGQPAPAYNGYILFGFPKREYSIDYVDDFIEKMVKDSADDSGYCVEGFADPDLN
jgi:hypothetical protein